MKLNTKRTMLVGLAFLSICIFWQMYDSVMTLILTDTFHLNETIAGAVMAADNVLALFLLPLFGALSDKTNTRIGRRMPYIIGGTAAAVALMNLLPVLDNAYAASPSPLILGLFIAVLALLLVAMGVYRSPAVAPRSAAFCIWRWRQCCTPRRARWRDMWIISRCLSSCR